MERHRKPRQIKVMEVERMKTFSDSIFAFAMTLLGTRITLPDIPLGSVSEQLPIVLMQQWRTFAMYGISFLSIGGYWVLHHAIFNHFQATDKTLLWFNMLLLLMVTFLPFPTALMAKYGRDSITASIYGLTISLNYALLLLVFWYGNREACLNKPDADPDSRRTLGFKLITLLSLAAIGTLLSFFYFRLSHLFYFLVMLSNALPLTRLANWQNNRKTGNTS